jgi:hypothetical protein
MSFFIEMRNMIKEKKTQKKLRIYPTEVFKEISLGDDDNNLQLFYAISNFGRLISYKDNIENGRIIKGSKQDGYRMWNYRIRLDAKKFIYRHRFIYKLVVEYFLPKPSAEHEYILHLNYVRSNDHVDNLKWATYEEMITHRYKSPTANKVREKNLPKLWAAKGGSTLKETQVRLLKKKLLNPNRKTKMKILARQFGVTEMQLYRIRSGENWGDIKV